MGLELGAVSSTATKIGFGTYQGFKERFISRKLVFLVIKNIKIRSEGGFPRKNFEQKLTWLCLLPNCSSALLQP